MKVVILQENLKKSLSFVGKSVSNKTQLPILSNILLETDAGRLKICSTNLETSISYWIGATIEEEGAVTIPARMFIEIISSFNEEKVELQTDKQKLLIKSGESEASLAGIDAKEFPPLPKPGKKRDAFLSSPVLEKGIAFVTTAASTDESRPLLTGVRFVVKDKKTIMVATDGFRLSIKQLQQVAGIEEGFVVPARALTEVVRAAIEEKEENIEVFFSTDKNQIIFLLPHMQIATRLIEGVYPKYENIIPASFLTQTIFIKSELARAVKLAAVYARESANVVKITIQNDKAIVSANMPQIGENKTSLTVKKEGEDGEIAFNVRFLLDLLSVFPEDEIVLETSGPLAPGVFKSTKDPSFLHIIMPVRVQS